MLEHLQDPWQTPRRAVRLLSPGGISIASLPSIRHLSTIFHLVERPHRINRYAKYLALPGLRGFLAFQYPNTARPAAQRER